MASISGYIEATGVRGEFDEADTELVNDRAGAYDERIGPRVGDYARFPDGHLERFSHDWGDGLQTSPGGSWYLGREGGVSFSGSLNPIVDAKRLRLTTETRPGGFWSFHHDDWRAHNAIHFELVCNLYGVTP